MVVFRCTHYYLGNLCLDGLGKDPGLSVAVSILHTLCNVTQYSK